jgi:hypothetical protein
VKELSESYETHSRNQFQDPETKLLVLLMTSTTDEKVPVAKDKPKIKVKNPKISFSQPLRLASFCRETRNSLLNQEFFTS